MITNWPIVKLGDVIYLDIDRVEVNTTQTYEMVGVYSFGRGLFHREPVHGGNTSYKKFYHLNAEHIVLSQLFGWEGAIALSSEEFAGKYVSPQFPTFRVNPERLERSFLGWFMRRSTFWEELGRRTRGMGDRRRTLNPDALLDCSIPLPPLSEQQRIVVKIEQLVSKIDGASALRYRSQRATNTFWKVRAANLLQGISLKYWKALGDLVEIGGGGTPSKGNPAFWNGNIPWVSPKDMKTREIKGSTQKITGAALEGSSVQLYEPRAVLVVVRGMILAHTFPAAVLKVPAAINQDMKALLPNQTLLPDYLCCVLWGLNDKILGLVDRSSHDTRRLVTPKLKGLTVPVPSIEKQRRIVAYLDRLQTKLELLERVQAQTAAELDAFLPSILDRALNGEL